MQIGHLVKLALFVLVLPMVADLFGSSGAPETIDGDQRYQQSNLTSWSPHVIDGVSRPANPVEFFATEFTLVNRSNASIEVTIQLFTDGEEPFSRLTGDGPGGGTSSTKTVHLPPFGSTAVRTSNGPFSIIGWARIDSTGELGLVTTLLYLREPGDVLTAASILQSEPLTSFSLPARVQTGGASTGVALLNPSLSETVELTVQLLDADGLVRYERVLSLAPQERTVRFLNEEPFFVELDAFSGLAEVVGSGPIAAVTIRVDGDHWSTFPVWPTP